MVTQMANNEGDAISFAPATSNATASAPLTFTATGLPEGVSINATTGLISGRLTYGTAEVNNRVYNVTITSSSANGADTGSATFEWDISDVNRITTIDDQVSEVGQAVNLQVQASDAFGHTLTYTAQGLPPGLAIDSATGLISGTPTGTTTTTTPVTVGVSDGTYTDTRSFNWSVVAATMPEVVFAINDTVNTNDDLLVVNSPSPTFMRVTLYAPGVNGPQSIHIQAPSDLVSLSRTDFQLADGQSLEIQVTPIKNSQVENDVDFVALLNGQAKGEIKSTDGTLTFVVTTTSDDHIRAANTPTGMADRIPPRVWTPYTVTYKTDGAKITDKAKFFWIYTVNQSNNNGYTKLKDKAGKAVDYDIFTPANDPNGYIGNICGKVTVQSVYQTVPGNAGNLKLAIFSDLGQDLTKYTEANARYKSNGFSVAAIPIGVVMRNKKIVQGTSLDGVGNMNNWAIGWGTSYDVQFLSDSENSDDLDKVKEAERVTADNTTATGIVKSILFKAIATSADKWLLASNPPPDFKTFTDNGEPKTLALAAARKNALDAIRGVIAQQGNGTGTAFQYFAFTDDRTSTDAIQSFTIPSSGFQITFDIGIVGGQARIIVTKTPKATVGVAAGTMPVADTQPSRTFFRL